MFTTKDKNRFLDELQNKYPTLYFLGDLIANIIVIVVMVYVVRTFLISPFQVSGPSMCDTLNNISGVCQDGFGEYLIVDKAVYYPFFGHRFKDPQRGDVVVFHPPHNEQEYYIKRIIGLSGETVKLQNGRVYIYNKSHQNGVELKEEYLNGENKNHTYPMPTQAVMTYQVPAGSYFVMGDNRERSTDSRACFKGSGSNECNDFSNHFVSISRIEGKAWIVLWPFNKIRLLKNPAYTF